MLPVIIIILIVMIFSVLSLVEIYNNKQQKQQTPITKKDIIDAVKKVDYKNYGVHSWYRKNRHK